MRKVTEKGDGPEKCGFKLTLVQIGPFTQSFNLVVSRLSLNTVSDIFLL